MRQPMGGDISLSDETFGWDLGLAWRHETLEEAADERN